MTQHTLWEAAVIITATMIAGCATDHTRDTQTRSDESTSSAQASSRPVDQQPPASAETMPSRSGSAPSQRLEGMSQKRMTGDMVGIEGEVVRVNGRTFESSQSYLIKDQSGQERVVHVTQATRLQGNPEVGDRIFAQITQDGRAVSIKTLSAASGMVPGSAAEAATIPSSEIESGRKAVTGNLLRMEGEYFVVRESSGREVRLQVDNDTKMQDAVQVGDNIEADISRGNHAEMVRKAEGAEQSGIHK